MLPLMSSSRIRFSRSSPWENETSSWCCPSSVTTKFSLARSSTRSLPCVTWTSSLTSATPALNNGVSSTRSWGAIFSAAGGCAASGGGLRRNARMKIVEMKHIIVGTAGHIDHGKTALVRALSGIDTDRLKEEKERGISIDLGFAHLDLPSGLEV